VRSLCGRSNRQLIAFIYSEFIMGIFHFLIVVQAIIAASLVGVILMQRSEGGGLGMGGSPSGLMSARGAADFLTRTTTILATLFIILSISLAFVAAKKGGTGEIDSSLERTEVPATPAAPVTNAPAAPASVAPASGVPLDK
jgi:preprotein translocase subunit SecG